MMKMEVKVGCKNSRLDEILRINVIPLEPYLCDKVSKLDSL